MMNAKHFILTRFNVREQPELTDVISDNSWLARRFSLFESFCLPSVAGQASHDFLWLIFMDELTPPNFRDRMRQHEANLTCIKTIYVTKADQRVASATITSLLPSDTEIIITSRLDNDDAISADYVSLIQREAQPAGNEILNIPNGLIWHKGRIYRHKDRSNAFATLVEKRTSMPPITVWARQHPKLSEIAPIRQIGESPAWLQVVHGGNRRNRVRGWRTRSHVDLPRFILSRNLLDRIDDTSAFYTDKLFLDPCRALREFGYVLAKAMLRQ